VRGEFPGCAAPGSNARSDWGPVRVAAPFSTGIQNEVAAMSESPRFQLRPNLKEEEGGKVWMWVGAVLVLAVVVLTAVLRQ